MWKLIAILRFAAFFLATVGVFWTWKILSFVIPNKIYWRQLIFRLWSRSFATIARMRVEVIGTPPKPPFFLVCNHLSYVDIPALRLVVDGVFVAKDEIRDWPLAGRMVRDMGNVFINRRNHRDIPRAEAEIVEHLEEGEGVMIFPEGTSTKGECVLPFNSSFFDFCARTDLPVAYCSISYKTPPGEMAASDAVCWWDDTTFINHMIRLLSVREFTAVVTFGDEAIVNTDRKKLARELHRRVSEKFIPVI